MEKKIILQTCKNNLNDSALQRIAKGQIKTYQGWDCKYETIILS